MAEKQVHIAQARHNEALAHTLISSDPPTFLDWSVTVCFYAAVHYVEAKFYDVLPEHHTSASVPKDPKTGKYKVEMHAHRQDLVRKHCSRQAWKDYCQLRNRSRVLRYLEDKGTFLLKPAAELVRLDKAKEYYNVCLKSIKQDSGIR